LGDIPQRARPFANRLAIDIIVTRTANNGCKWVCGLVERKTSEFERRPEKFVGFSPYPVMLNDCEHGIQVPIHSIASAACLKVAPRMSELQPLLKFTGTGFDAVGRDLPWKRNLFDLGSIERRVQRLQRLFT
jgi:hypothetical protein